MQTAICLHSSVIKLIRDISNKGDASTRFNSLQLNCVGAETVEKVALLCDCPPFFSFIYLSLLISATLFLKDSEVFSAALQINTIYLCKRYFMTSDFKSVQQDTATEMFENAVSALQEENSF